MRRALPVLVLALGLPACFTDTLPPADAGDSAVVDVSADMPTPTDQGAPVDTGAVDAGREDAGTPDAGAAEDVSPPTDADASPTPGDDGSAVDASVDGGAADARPTDAPEAGITCPLGLADCDRNPANGCEVNTQSDRLNCGTCGQVCAETLPNVMLSSCVRGACQADSCAAGWGNCDTLSANGCETRLGTDPMHCGYCQRRCAMGQVCREADCAAP